MDINGALDLAKREFKDSSDRQNMARATFLAGYLQAKAIVEHADALRELSGAISGAIRSK